MRTVLTVMVLSLSTIFLGGWWTLQRELSSLNNPLNVAGGSVNLVIAPGMTLSEVSVDLETRGMLDNPRSLVWYARWHDLAHRIKAGEYAVPPRTTPIGLLALLIEGKVIQWPFTIVEGWTFHQLREQLALNQHLVHTLTDLDDEAVMTKLGHQEFKPEGWFFSRYLSFPKGHH